MTSANSGTIGQFLTEAAEHRGGERRSGSWVRGLVVVGVMTLLVLGMNPDGGRHIPVTSHETTAKLVLAVGLGMVSGGRFLARRAARPALA